MADTSHAAAAMEAIESLGVDLPDSVDPVDVPVGGPETEPTEVEQPEAPETEQVEDPIAALTEEPEAESTEDPPEAEPEVAEVEDPEDEVPEDEHTEDDETAPEDGPTTLADEATFDVPELGELTGKELREGYLRQKDYTQKTQEVAEERRQVEQAYQQMANWYESRAADPESWVHEIASQTEAPDRTLAGAISRSEDPTRTMVLTMKRAVESGAMSDDFIEAFGLQNITSRAETAEAQTRIERVEQQQREMLRQQQEQAQVQQALAQLNNEWEQIKTREGLAFDDPQAEMAAKRDALAIAKQRGLRSLTDAWAVKKYLAAESGASTPAAPSPAPAPATSTQQSAQDDAASKAAREAVRKKKEQTGVINTNPSRGATPPPRGKRQTYKSAAEEAIAELGI